LPASIEEAVLDTMPDEYRTLLMTQETARVVAFEKFNAMCSAATRGKPLNPLRMRDRARDVWTEFAERATQAKKLKEHFGWDDSEAWKVQGGANIQTDKLDHVMRVAELAGRMYADMKGSAANKVERMVGELYSVEQGDDLSRVLPAEKAALGDVDRELEFYSKLSARKLAQYSVRGTGKVARGDIVVLIDESDSMQERVPGGLTRNDWAKSAAIALARVAKEQKRRMVVIHYSTSIEVQPFNPSSSDDVVQMVTTFLTGGTRIGSALAEAARQIGDMPNADAILVTDGIDGETYAIEQAIGQLWKKDARLFTIAIGCQIPSEHPLAAGSVNVTTLDDNALNDSKTATFAMAGALK
jgi:uncharacterized protein with von Willebrand factor type A (vWA) domain